ncbi:MAG: hypothetical protein WBC19_08785 [Pyrinomonadaceae bacterium]|nr:hypothetical protein [Pyrinomonadaceae bacterium]
MDSVPSYVSTVFILTTFAAVAFLLRAVKGVGLGKLPSQILIFLLPLWIFFQAVVSIGGFYQNTTAIPPRIVLFGVLPALLTIVTYVIFFRQSFIDKIPLRILTMLHIVRIPVEIVLLWLFQNGLVPKLMTFEGWNFDILSGILAPIVYLIAFRGDKANRGLLIAFNIIGLILLANIVTIAVLSIPTPFQQLAFDQPNRAVAIFPYSWLPTIVVPIVLFSHIAALWKLLGSKTD